MALVVYNVFPSGHCLSQSDAARKELGQSFWKRFQAIGLKMSLKSTYQSKRSKTGACDKMLTICMFISTSKFPSLKCLCTVNKCGVVDHGHQLNVINQNIPFVRMCIYTRSM